jgi:beta-lactamase regulating signal transducer with metallopeptidase domain
MITVANLAAEVWWDWMAPMFWQSSILIIIVASINWLIRRWAWPQVRHALWILVLLRLLIPPSWSLPTSLVSMLEPRFNSISSQLLVSDPSPQRESPEAREPPLVDARWRPAVGISSPASADPPARVSPRALAMAIWAAGALAFGALLGLKMLKLRRWHEEHRRRGAIPDWFHARLVQVASRLGIERLPAVVFSPDTVSPAVYGVVRPVLLLPADYFDHLTEAEGEHVLVHELAHLKRRDLWVQGLALALHVVYWFNPLMILMQRQSKQVREICCDLTVAAVLKEKTIEYRNTLLNMARELLTRRVEVGLSLLGIFEEPFRLITRLQWLEKQPSRRGKLVMAASAGASLLVMLLIMPMGPAAPKAAPASGAKLAGSPSAGATVDPTGAGLELMMSKPLYAAVLPAEGDPELFLETSKARLDDLMRDAGVRPTGPVFGRFFFADSEDAPEGGPFWEIGYPVAPGTTVSDPLEIVQVSPLQMAVTRAEGRLDITPEWLAFAGRIVDAGYLPFPPSMLVWTGEQDFWQKAEMRVPVMRSDATYPGIEVSHTNRAGFTALTLPMHGSYAQHGHAVAQLDDYARDNEINITGDLFGLYWADATTTPRSEFDWVVGYPVAPGTQARAPFRTEEFEAVRVASATFEAGRYVHYPWAPVVMRTLLSGNVPVGPPMVSWRTESGRNITELEIPVSPLTDREGDRSAWDRDGAGDARVAGQTKEGDRQR